MALSKHEMEIAELLAKYVFIEHCKEKELITLEAYVNICNSWGDKALALIQHYLRKLDEYHEDTRKFVDEITQSEATERIK